VILIDQLGDAEHRLIRLALIIIEHQLDLLAVDAALGLDLVERHLIAVLVRLAERGLRAGDRRDDADAERLAVGLAAALASRARGDDEECAKEPGGSHHGASYPRPRAAASPSCAV
jgi:hypothetical protein